MIKNISVVVKNIGGEVMKSRAKQLNVTSVKSDKREPVNVVKYKIG